MHDKSLLSAKDGEPLFVAAAVKVATSVEVYLKALDLGKYLDIGGHIQAMRQAHEDYRECIEQDARHGK